MGLKDKAAEARKAAEVKGKLSALVDRAGTIDEDYAKEKIGCDRKTLMSAAKELDVEGVLEAKSRFLGKAVFTSITNAGRAVNPEELIGLVEKRGAITSGRAARELEVSVKKVGDAARDLEGEKLVHIEERFLRDTVIHPNPLEILKYRITKNLKEKRCRRRVIFSTADYILGLAKGGRRITVADAAKVLGKDEAYIEDEVKRMSELLQLEYPANPSAPPLIRFKSRPKKQDEECIEGRTLDSYPIEADEVPAKITIIATDEDSMPRYFVDAPQVGEGTKAILNSFSGDLSTVIKISSEEISDQKKLLELKGRFYDESLKALKGHFDLPPEDIKVLAGIMLHNMFGLGNIELLMHDDWLEEVCVNTSRIPITAYHKRFGWVKTNLTIEDERGVYNYAAQIGRKVEKDITNLEPIMDAHLLSGDRVNATLFPISNFGNTITIRKFARQPWTVTQYISPNLQTMNREMAAFLWLCFQYELNVIIGGGTASGKTSVLNCLCSLIQPTQRIITIEDTRELNLPRYLMWNWIPLTTRSPNPEGKGEVGMLDLIVTSLRMRPDRIVFGEIRRRGEAEVLFEAMHTGHSVYSTIHADTAENLKRRLIEPPFEIPAAEIEALHLILIVYRDRRKGDRRVYEIAEIIPNIGHGEFELNYLYRWNPRAMQFAKINESRRVLDELGLHTGMMRDEIARDLNEKEEVLQWMLDKNIRDLDGVGEVMDEYYKNPKRLLEKVRGGGK